MPSTDAIQLNTLTSLSASNHVWTPPSFAVGGVSSNETLTPALNAQQIGYAMNGQDRSALAASTNQAADRPSQQNDKATDTQMGSFSMPPLEYATQLEDADLLE